MKKPVLNAEVRPIDFRHRVFDNVAERLGDTDLPAVAHPLNTGGGVHHGTIIIVWHGVAVMDIHVKGAGRLGYTILHKKLIS